MPIIQPAIALSTRQEAFCRHYAVSGNAADAARRAGSALLERPYTSGLYFGLIGRLRHHIVAPDPDPGPISGPCDLPRRRKWSATGGVAAP